MITALTLAPRWWATYSDPRDARAAARVVAMAGALVSFVFNRLAPFLQLD